MARDSLSVGQLSARTGCKVPTIRYYEEIGLLGVPPRTEGGHRTYGAHDVSRLVFIRRSRELGFSLDVIRSLLDLAAHPEKSCAEVDQLAIDHLGQIAEKLRLLSAMQGALQDMLDRCHHTTIHECRVIDALSPETDPAPDSVGPTRRLRD